MKNFACAALAVTLCCPLAAKSEGFQVTDNCIQTIRQANEVDQLLLGAWVIGYLDSINQSASLVRYDNAQVVLRNLTAACEANPDATIIQIVQSSKKDTPETAGTKSHAEVFLKQFLEPNADLVALTSSLRPTPADIRAVYAPQLAERLIPMYDGMFAAGAQIGPKSGQTQLLLWRGTTDALKRGDPVLEDFPGGYEEVRPYLLGQHPIVRFKFVVPGETLGMAFDGLVHVNGRWVLMPKPWRALDN